MSERVKFSDMVMKFVDYLVVILMAVLLLMISFQVANRFIFRIPAAWTEEMGRYCFVWLSLFATVRALKDRAHLSVDILTNKLEGNKKVTADIVSDLLTLIFSIILTITGYQYTVSNIGNYCEFGEFPLFVIYIAIPITGLLLCFVSIEQICSSFTKIEYQKSIKG